MSRDASAKVAWKELLEENRNWPLIVVSIVALVLQGWVVVEAILLWPRARGVLEESLPALDHVPARSA